MIRTGKPRPFTEAIDFLKGKNLLPTTLSSAQIGEIDASVTRAAMISAKVTDAAFLDQAHELIQQIVDPQHAGGAAGSYMDKATARLT